MNVPIPASIDLAPLANIAPDLQKNGGLQAKTFSPAALGIVAGAALIGGIGAVAGLPAASRRGGWLGVAFGVGLAGLAIARWFARTRVSVREVPPGKALS